MPLYEYECQSCGRREELIQRVGAPPVGPCDECGGEMKRLLSAPAFQFKGSGWYVTDYAKKGGSGTGEEKSSPAGKAPKQESKKDKPDPKPKKKDD